MNRRLLWADRDSRFISIGERFLDRCGFQVLIAADALACLQRLKDSFPDVLILDDDLLWGGFDGVLAWLREELPPAEQPIVLLSGEDWPEAVSARTGVAAACCLRKPYRLPAILDAVAAETERRRADVYNDLGLVLGDA
jgi:DNA-binding response OmpR family regulator